VDEEDREEGCGEAGGEREASGQAVDRNDEVV